MLRRIAHHDGNRVTVEPSLEETEASDRAFCRLSGRQVHGPLSLIGYQSGGSAITQQ